MAKAPEERPNHGESNNDFFFFSNEVGTTVWPREFHHFVSKTNSHGKIAVAIPQFLLH